MKWERYVKLWKEQGAEWKEVSQAAWLALFHQWYDGEPVIEVLYQTPFSYLKIKKEVTG